MSKGRKRVEEDQPDGAPDWMVTFSDCMTLLLTFFVLLLSYSSFDELVFLKLRKTFLREKSSISNSEKRNRDALLSAYRVQYLEEVDKGSEKETFEQGDKDNMMREGYNCDFHSLKVFLKPSSEIFWAKGGVISRSGKDILVKMADYLERTGGQVVISENSSNKKNDGKGFSRAWAVMNYFVKECGLDEERFSISATTTLDRENIEQQERNLEVVLLERSVYN